MILLLVPFATANAQVVRNERQVPDPFQFLERFLGEESEADRAALKNIRISRREEAQAGGAASESFLRQLKQQGTRVQERGADVHYIQRLVAELRPLMKNARRYREIQVRVLDTADTDARSFPGGTIVVYRGLIDYCESEAALVGVLGHELSHVDRGHQLIAMKRWKLAQKSFSTPTPERLMSAGGIMTRMFTQPFRPSEESEADQDGARWAFMLGYDPLELARVFLRMHERDAGQPNFTPSFLQSHPFHQDRYQALVKLSNQLKAREPDAAYYVGKENLRRRTPRVERSFPEELRQPR